MVVYWQLLWQYLPETFFEGLSVAAVTVGLHDSGGRHSGQVLGRQGICYSFQLSTKNIDLCENFNPKKSCTYKKSLMSCTIPYIGRACVVGVLLIALDRRKTVQVL